MKNKSLSFTIGEMCKILNVSHSGIRFYEKKGLVESRREDGNQYRYYTFRDFATMLSIREYKNLGFSVEEARELIGGDNLKNIEVSFEGQINKIEELIKYNEYLVQKLIEKKDTIGKIEQWVNRFQVTKRESLYRLNCQDGGNLISNKKLNKLIKSWSERFPKVKLCPRMKGENLNSKSIVEVGFGVWAKELDFEIEDEEFITFYPETKVVYTIIEVTDENRCISGFYRTLEPTIRFIRENNYEVHGDILGEKIITLNNGKQTDYYEIYVPIK